MLIKFKIHMPAHNFEHLEFEQLKQVTEHVVVIVKA